MSFLFLRRKSTAGVCKVHALQRRRSVNPDGRGGTQHDWGTSQHKNKPKQTSACFVACTLRVLPEYDFQCLYSFRLNFFEEKLSVVSRVASDGVGAR